ncbi:MAG: D-alanine--D-alanine ligase [Treponema sp.]|nr:D-alanine--D-alanine ligase [Treponema sp.]
MTPNKQKITVGILFGGKSAEHDVSLQSAKNVYEAIDRSKYEPVLIGIDKSGKWHLTGDAFSFANNGKPAALIPESKGLLCTPGESAGSPKIKLDVVFPVLHGPFGEDGTVQGLLKLAGIPFAGSGVLGSAVGMDKDVMKRLFREAALPIGKFITIKPHEPIPSFAEIATELGSPVFVKPANMGSSVGINKAANQAEFSAAVNEAFQFDTKILLEEFIPGREIECAVLGNETPQASVPGEVIPSHAFYSYKAKYLDEKGAVLQVPAQLDKNKQKQIQDLSVKAFQVLCCEGLARVDFFLKENGEVLVNEINTMPGFTKISMYPKLWEASGIGYSELISRIIKLAVNRLEKEQLLITHL